MKKFLLTFAAVALVPILFGESAIFAADSATPIKPNYPRAAQPAVAPAFTPLPLGHVEPQGWLRDWAVAMKDGITGHLDERSPVFRDGWKGIPIAWTGAKPDGTGWPLEQCAYWLDGAIRLGYILHDEPLVEKIRARLDPIVDGVNRADFGTTFVYWKKNWKPSGFNSWAHSHMGRALLGLYSGSGEKKVLDALVKVYADYPDNMGEIHFHDVLGACNIDPMLETYALSGDSRILPRVLAVINQPQVRQTCLSWGAPDTECSHLVCTYENLRLPAVTYPWTGKREFLDATRKAILWLEERHQMPYGLASGEEFVAGVGAGRKTETCNIPALLLAADRMYRIEGDGAWGDRMEKDFFNAGPAPLSRDCRTAAYYQAPNRIRLGVLPIDSTAPCEVGGSSIKFGPLACDKVLCCIGACNRILPYFLSEMWMATADNGLAATLYGPCTVSALAGDHVRVKVASATGYPFEETIRMTVTPEEPVEFPLYLRVPGWCTAPAIAINGRETAAETAPGKKGFVRLSRTWRKGDEITIRLPMTVSVSRGTEGSYPSSIRGYFARPPYPIPAALFLPCALPFATVNYGPLLFALPIPEKDENTPVEGAKYQYALDLQPAESASVKVARQPMPAHWDWPYDAPLSLEVPVRPFDWKPSVTQALPPAPVAGGDRAMVKLVPYGCAKFHISMFPVTPHAWEGEPPRAIKKLPELLGNAGPYDDPAATQGIAVGYINAPGSGVVWRDLPAGKQLKLRYSAVKAAQLTLRINDTAARKIAFPATGKWQGEGAYAEVIVRAEVPADAVVRLSYEAGDTPANIDFARVAE